jgi:methylated-DNA-[protein]-cysteine S-methyltransferase
MNIRIRNDIRYHFQEQVWELCKKVPRGNVTTYKELAHALGTKAYRAVGNALNRNPYAPIVPCHRVVKSNGSLGGFAKGQEKKKELLEEEGLQILGRKIVDFEKRLFRF